MNGIICLEKVTKCYKNEVVLDNINTCYEKGKIYGIVGKNGSGKTMLFKSIVGFVRPNDGHIYVNGKEIGKDIDFAQDIGLIIETPGFLSQYNAFKNLKYLASIRNKISNEQIAEAIIKVGLDPSSNKKVGKYSLGMKQRLGIAQAIMEGPGILLLDEPMNGLDKDGIELIRKLLQQLKQEGKTIILSSHYEEDVRICDEIYEMDKGRLVKKEIEKER